MFLGIVTYDPIGVYYIEDPYTFLARNPDALVSFIFIVATCVFLEYLIVSTYGKIPLLWFALVNIATFILFLIPYSYYDLVLGRYFSTLIGEALIILLESAAYIIWFNSMNLIQGYRSIARIILLSTGANIVSTIYSIIWLLMIPALATTTIITRAITLIGATGTIAILVIVLTTRITKDIPLSTLPNTG